MASRTLIVLEDDVDGSVAEETVQFSIDGVSYEIDLSGDNAQKLRKAVDPFRSAARRIGERRRRRSSSAPVSTGEVDTKAVRAWAESNGVAVSSRGRIAADVVEKYRKAGH
jgi:hypothetical protein